MKSVYGDITAIMENPFERITGNIMELGVRRNYTGYVGVWGGARCGSLISAQKMVVAGCEKREVLTHAGYER